MMDMKEFQAKLGQIVAKAGAQNKNLTQEDILAIFGENQLNAQQLQSLYEYLRLQGIRIEGVDLQRVDLGEQVAAINDAKEQAANAQAETELVPMEMEDETYYKEYKGFVASLPSASPKDREKLLQKYAKGNLGVQEQLTQSYQAVILELARTVYQKGIFLADLIQEGNMSLLMVSPWDIPDQEADLWMQEQIVVGMREWIAMQAEQKLQDEYMVEKVKKLESAIRDLSDDDNQKFSVEELSAFLDMDEEEIRDILSLAGENPEGE